MNAYLITEDGDSRVWIATTMTSALELAWIAYVDEQDPDDLDDNERQIYEQDILQGCALLGEVANP